MLAESLCHQVKLLQEEVSRLFSITDDEKEIDGIFSETLQIQEPKPAALLGRGRQNLCLLGWEKEMTGSL